MRITDLIVNICVFVSSEQELQCFYWSSIDPAAHPLFQIFQILQCLKDLTCAIFLKIMGFKYIKYDIPVYQM